MQSDRPDAPFEVHCGRCRVTFPVGTRRCVHCGGPTGPARESGVARLGGPPEGGGSDMDPDALVRPRSFSPLTLLWIAVVVGGYAMRACSGH